MASFRRGPSKTGLVENRNYTIENRSAEGQYDRLPALAAELVARQVAIVAADFLPAALAAKAASQSVPVVFVSGSDPIRSGLATSLSRPTGNVTGIAFMFTLLGGKNLQLLREAAPKANVIGVLVNTSNPNAKPQLADLEAAGRALGQELVAFGGHGRRDRQRLCQTGRPSCRSTHRHCRRFPDQPARPTRFPRGPLFNADDVPAEPICGAGGLVSYGANLSEAFWQAGVYVGKILNGTKPSELPVLRSSKFELAVNLNTAKALGLEIPPTILSVADEVNE